MAVLVSFADKRDVPLSSDICGEVVYLGGVVALEYSPFPCHPVSARSRKLADIVLFFFPFWSAE